MGIDIASPAGMNKTIQREVGIVKSAPVAHVVLVVYCAVLALLPCADLLLR